MAQGVQTVAPLGSSAGNAFRMPPGSTKETSIPDLTANKPLPGSSKKRPRSPSPERRASPVPRVPSGIFAAAVFPPTAQGDGSIDNNHEDEPPIIDNCDVVRRKINAFLNSGEMKVTHFQRACGINAGSYGRFMKLKGPYSGIDNQTYEAAFGFFKDREEKGLKIPANRNKKQKVDGGEGAKGGINVEDLKNVHLDGEEDEQVEVYDTCDDVRRKIAAHLRKPGVTKAGFCRDICAVAFPNDTKSIQGSRLKDFQTKKGPDAGNSSNAFYAAYVYFEKLRIKEGKKKGKKREEMEEVWGNQGGFSRELNRCAYICAAGRKPFMDSFGKVIMMRSR